MPKLQLALSSCVFGRVPPGGNIRRSNFGTGAFDPGADDKHLATLLNLLINKLVGGGALVGGH